GIISLESLEKAEPGDIVPRSDDDLAALMYTGGTTGRAKGVMLSHFNLWSCGKSAQSASDVRDVTRSVVPLRLSHCYGLIASVLALHSDIEGDAILMRWFDPTGRLELTQE